MNELEAKFCLSATGVFSPEKQFKILNHFSKAVRFFKEEQLAIELVGKVEYESFLRACEDIDKLNVYQKLITDGVRLVLKEDAEYPKSLQYVECPPHLLYVKGSIPKESLFGVSIIGTRKASMYGRQQAQKFGRELAEMGFTVISGIARGIDSIAMNAALEVKSPVVGVMGNGIDVVYPAENKGLYERISTHGALISEFHPGAKPLKHHFPWRNRLISAWALGLLVIEATVKSGTMVTVKWALNQGKDIFALPGPVHNETSRGCHQMIRDGAHLVESPHEIFQFYEHLLKTEKKELEKDSLQENELGLTSEPISVEELMLKLGKDYVEVVRMANKAVAEGWAKRHPGGRYSLI